jgi:hypothetical protein
METIFLSVFLLVMLYFMSRVVAAYLRVRDEGVSHSEELLRNGVSLGRLLNGDVEDRGTGALIPKREGLLMEAGDTDLEVRGTRTIARDIF